MTGKRRRLDTSSAENAATPVKRMLTVNRDLKARLQKLYDQLQTSQRELDLSEDTIFQAVQIALELNGQPPLIAAHVENLKGRAL